MHWFRLQMSGQVAGSALAPDRAVAAPHTPLGALLHRLYFQPSALSCLVAEACIREMCALLKVLLFLRGEGPVVGEELGVRAAAQDLHAKAHLQPLLPHMCKDMS